MDTLGSSARDSTQGRRHLSGCVLKDKYRVAERQNVMPHWAAAQGENAWKPSKIQGKPLNLDDFKIIVYYIFFIFRLRYCEHAKTIETVVPEHNSV